MTDVVTLPSDRQPAHIGQATAVEQSRAVAEVKAAVVVAQQCPRDVQTAVAAMRESCAQDTLAQQAFFRYSRAGSPIQGASIHLAKELARVWGNIQYGVSELRRDDYAGESEMQAYAWDIQTNTRMASIWVVPHARDTKNGRKALTELRDVYENNANQGARRVREAIFAVLPPWFIEEAKDLCTETLANGGGKPLAQRIADAVKWFESMGIRLSQLEEKVGRKRSEWEGVDLARLEIINRSVRNGEISLDEEFPAPRVSADEITKPRAKAKDEPAAPLVNLTTGEVKTPQTDDAAPPTLPSEGVTPPAAAASSEVITKAQLTKLHTSFTEAGIADRNKRLTHVANILGVEVASSKDLSKAQAHKIIESLEAINEAPFGDEPPVDEGAS